MTQKTFRQPCCPLWLLPSLSVSCLNLSSQPLVVHPSPSLPALRGRMPSPSLHWWFSVRSVMLMNSMDVFSPYSVSPFRGHVNLSVILEILFCPDYYSLKFHGFFLLNLSHCSSSNLTATGVFKSLSSLMWTVKITWYNCFYYSLNKLFVE